MRSDPIKIQKPENNVANINKQSMNRGSAFEQNRKSVDIPSVPSIKFRRQLIDDYNNFANKPKDENSNAVPTRHKTPGRYVMNKSEDCYGANMYSKPTNELPKIQNNGSVSPSKRQDANKTLDHPSTRLDMQHYAQQTLSKNPQLGNKSLLNAESPPKISNRIEELR